MNSISAIDFALQAPLLLLVVTGLLLVLAEAFFQSRSYNRLMAIAVAGCVGAGVTAVVLYRQLGAEQSEPIMNGMLVADRFGYFFTVLIAALTAATALISARHQQEHEWEEGAFYGILLLSASGMVVMAMADNLVTIFLGIETMSLGVYVLTAMRRYSLRSSEAAMKYFMMGAFATGFLLYGIALIYGATGYTNLTQIKTAMTSLQSPGIAIAGIFFLVVALAFKVAAIPFHMWAPDAYEGAPTPVTGFMAGVVKAAAFAVFLRLFGNVFAGDALAPGYMGWASPLMIIAALTMTIANVAALRQENIKRMLAYSSISHAGIVLVGVLATGLSSNAAMAQEARAGVMYYLAAYGITTIGAFAVAAWIGARGRERTLVDDWAGLAAQHPAAALAMTVFMLSLGGIPPTAGFFGKFYVFKSAMQVYDQQLLWLVVLGVVNSAISIYYYLRVVMAMYFRDAVDRFKPLSNGAITFVMVVCALAVFQMGLLPGFWLSVAGVGG